MLVIATNWPESRRGEVERALDPTLVHWIRVSASEDPTRMAGRASVDLFLGGPISSYERLARRGSLAEIPGNGGSFWVASELGRAGLMINASEKRRLQLTGDISPGDPRLADRVALIDPRFDPDGALSANLVAAAAYPAEWATEYAGLVQLSSNARTISRDRGCVLRDLERGRATVAVLQLEGVVPRSGLEAIPMLGPSGVASQGVGIAADAPHPNRAIDAIRTLIRGKILHAVSGPRPGVVLLPDLLGSTLVDAHAELRAARSVINAHDDPARSLAWMTEAPPWPPASVEKMRSKPDGETLVTLLAEQVAPDPEARDWLMRSWNRSPRPIDGSTLDELATAADGRLAAEPRFRAWLRSEWTAWARQRYRRVVRQIDDPRFSKR